MFDVEKCCLGHFLYLSFFHFTNAAANEGVILFHLNCWLPIGCKFQKQRVASASSPETRKTQILIKMIAKNLSPSDDQILPETLVLHRCTIYIRVKNLMRLVFIV